jgi:hypothetical protein
MFVIISQVDKKVKGQASEVNRRVGDKLKSVRGIFKP